MLPTLAAAEVRYEWTPAAVSAYEQIMQLELAAATATSSAIQKNDPGNLVFHHLDNYIDFFRLYLSEDEDLLEKRLPRRDERLAALEQLSESSPWRNYALAEVRLHWALIRLRFESYYPAFRDVNKAHKLLRANARDFPDFLLTYKNLGLLHAAVGSIPPQFKWGVELFSSLSGSIRQGAKEMELTLADKGGLFYRETAVLHAFLELHLNGRPEVAWSAVNRLGLSPKTNKLHCFVLANVAMRSGRNNQALELLNDQPRGGNSEDFPYLDFMLGLARIRNLQTDAAVYFQSFLLRFRGQHFVREAEQKIAWCAWLRDDEAAYRKRMRQIGTRGNSTSGGDRNADNEARAESPPHRSLLRARLLFDGAYYSRARTEVDRIDPESLQSETERLELTYRTGRILHGLKQYPGALSFYERTIAAGSENENFFACNAALQAGLIEEIRGNEERARRYFERCLSLNPDEYKTGLHIQAKAGLNRL